MRPFLIALLLLTGCGARWGALDTGLQVAHAATVAADWAQSEQILEDGRELNPLLRGGVPTALYFPAVAAANYAIMRALPPPTRRAAQWIILGIQAFTIYRNGVLGYGFAP